MACWAIWWLLHLMLPRSRSVGYTFWRGVIVLLLGMTIVQLGPARSLVTVETQLISPLSPVDSSIYDRLRTLGASSASAVEGAAPAAKPSHSFGWMLLELLLHSLTWLWAIGLVLGTANFIAAHLRLARIRKGARSMKDPDLLILLENGRHKLGITRPVELQCHPEVDVPFTWGIWRPRIVLPQRIGSWPRKDRQMAILHELAHIRGYDTLFQGLATILGLLHWMNPLIWMGWRRFAMDRELHADAAVLATGVSPTSYASLLVRLAGCQNRPSPIAIAAVSMARPSTVPKRVGAILSGSLNRKGVRAPILWISMGMLGGIALTLGLTSLIRSDQNAGAGNGDEFLYTVYQLPEDLATELGYEPPKVGPNEALHTVGLHGMINSGYLDVTDQLEASFGLPHAPENYAAVMDQGSLLVRCSPANHALLKRNLQEQLGSDGSPQIYFSAKIVLLEADSPVSLAWLPQSRSGTPLELAGVFTDPQYQVLIRALSQQPGANLVSLPSLMSTPGESGQIALEDEYLVELHSDMASDGKAIEVSCKVRSSKLAQVSSKVSIMDGQTFALTHRKDDRIGALTFITARLIDPYGSVQ